MNKTKELRRFIINDLFLNMDEDQATDTLERIDEYAQQVGDEKCNDCVHTFQKRGTQGYHDVEEYYRE